MARRRIFGVGVCIASLAAGSAAAYTVPGQPNSTAHVHVFFYPWYGNPTTDGSWIHWNQAGHSPPDDVASNYYPKLGAYSSKDTSTIDQHMAWLSRAHAKVLVYSWWGRGGREDQLALRTLDSADRNGVKVCFHIEPYGGRTGSSVKADIQYLYDTYGSHPAFLTVSRSTRWGATSQPRGVFYVFESGRISNTDWRANLDSLRGTAYDAIVIGQTTDASQIDASHFDGLYSYDALSFNGTEFQGISDTVKSLNSIFSASVGPGYLDQRVGGAGNKPRQNGDAYDSMFQNTMNCRTEWISITSFNEWHEGTQIEPATPKSIPGFTYSSYEGAWGKTGADAELAYIDRTAYWIDRYEGQQLFATGLESGEPLESWQDTVEYSQNVSGYCCGLTHMESSRRQETAHRGLIALMYSGKDDSSSISYSYNRIFDVNIPVAAGTKLSYWIYPQYANATYVAIDAICTDGTTLRDSGALDQWGVQLHPGAQGNGGHLVVNGWTQVRSTIGAALAGKTIDRILIGYDQYPNTGLYRGYADDLVITDGNLLSDQVLFSGGFEPGDPPATWDDTVDFSVNVNGWGSGLTHMQSSARTERPHTGASSLLYSGNDASSTISYSYNKVFDVNIPVSSTTKLGYWVYPQQTNGTFFAIDLIFTDGSNLRDSGAVDQWGVRVHPSFQGNGGHLAVNAWTQVRSTIGAAVAGKTIDRILVAYDQYPATGQFRGFVDDIVITDGALP
jgi:hypothetical protein